MTMSAAGPYDLLVIYACSVSSPPCSRTSVKNPCGILIDVNCPGCGASVEAGQYFCRACGAAVGSEVWPLIHPRTVMLTAVLLVFAGLIVAVTGGMVDLRWLKFTGVYIMLAGFLSLVAGNLILQRIAETRTRWRIADERTRRHRSSSPEHSREIDRADTTNKPLPVGENDFIPPTVVEHTTKHLKQPASRK